MTEIQEVKRTNIYLPIQLHAKLRQQALDLGTSMTALMNELIVAGYAVNYPDEIPPINPEVDK